MQIINGGQTCKTIFQTINEHLEIDFTDVEVLVRIYEVNNDEKSYKRYNLCDKTAKIQLILKT